MTDENIILGNSKKSFLRQKWEGILKNIIINYIPDLYLETNQVIFLNNEQEIKNFFFNKEPDYIKKIKIIVILVPFNNFTNLLKFLDQIDKILDDDTKIIINYFSVSWKYIFKIFSFFGLIKNFNKSLFFQKRLLTLF